MKINKATTSKRKIAYIITAIALLVAGAALAYYMVYKPTANDSSNNPNDAKITDRKESPVGEVNYDKPSNEEEDPTLDPIQPQDQQQPANTIPTTISYTGGSPLQIRVLIGELLGSGTCTLKLQKGTQVVTTQTVEIFPSASSTTCKGFTVDTSSFEKGSYKVVVSISSASRTGSAEQDISL